MNALMKLSVICVLYLLFVHSSPVNGEAKDQPFDCMFEAGGAEVNIFCPAKTTLISGLGSKSPFFGDAISHKCTEFGEIMYDESAEIKTVHAQSEDEGLSISAVCPSDTDVVLRYSLCVKDRRVHAMTIECGPVKDPERIERVFNETSERWADALTDCYDTAGFQGIFMFPGDVMGITRVVHQCVLFNVDSLLDMVPIDKPATG